jgi:hypothetical protein
MRDTGDAGFPGEADDADEIDELDPREAQRTRRRDHDLDAEGRALLRPGMGKVFKQILDHQSKEASSDQDRPRKGAGRGHKQPR